MYEAFFGLKRRPFLFVPDLEGYVSTDCMEDAYQKVRRTQQEEGGISLILGVSGTGKTLLLRRLRQTLASDSTVTLVSNSRIETADALFRQLSHDLNIEQFGSESIELRLQIIDFAKQQPQQCVILLFDDAQHLSSAVLEEIRLLTDSFQGSRPLFQVILAGTTELEETLTLPNLEAFNQRICSRCYLEPFSREETSRYISRQTDDLRIDSAHENVLPLFTESGKQRIHCLTDGLPRLINQLCGTAMQIAAEKEELQITETLLEEAWAGFQHIQPISGPDAPAVFEPAISPEELEEIVDQKKKTFQIRPFNSIEFGSLADSEFSSETVYKPAYPEDDEDLVDDIESDETTGQNDLPQYSLHVLETVSEELIESESLLVHRYKLTLDYNKRRNKYRRQLLLRKIQHRLGLFAGILQPVIFQAASPSDAAEMNTQSLEEYGAAVLNGRPPFVRKELHYAYQTTETNPHRADMYPDPKTGVPVVLHWLKDGHQENGRFGVSYSDFLTGGSEEHQIEESACPASVEDVSVIRSSLNTSESSLTLLSGSGWEESFDESHHVERAAISLAELFQANSNTLHRRSDALESAGLDETIRHQLEAAVSRIARAAEKIEQAAEISEQAGRHVSRAAEYVENEVKSAVPTYLDMFKELSEFQRQVSAELESARCQEDDRPKFRTFPRRQVMIERTVPSIDVESLLR